jgi:hypothetical protein
MIYEYVVQVLPGLPTRRNRARPDRERCERNFRGPPCGKSLWTRGGSAPSVIVDYAKGIHTSLYGTYLSGCVLRTYCASPRSVYFFYNFCLVTPEVDAARPAKIGNLLPLLRRKVLPSGRVLPLIILMSQEKPLGRKGLRCVS